MKQSLLALSLILTLAVVSGCGTSTSTQSTATTTNKTVTNTTNTNTATKDTLAVPRDFTAGLVLPITDTSDFTTTASGLQYKDLTNSRSEVAAKAGDLVTVDYTGTLEDGTEFDSSMTRDQAFQFTLGAGEVIKGWDEGVDGMTLGQERILIIPADLAYGDQAVGGVIPAGATLQFEVKLQAIQ